MSRILTGIQSTGPAHLGNLLGAIYPAISLAKSSDQALFFIADLHTLTTIKETEERKAYTLSTAAAWLASGLDVDRMLLYRQSRIPEVCELAWYLGCLTPYPMLANAHAFKDKSGRLQEVNAGLFTYPVLMAADILLYQADIVPIGLDQVQHLEITRDIAKAFNNQYGQVFTLPEVHQTPKSRCIPGIDGQKMSKSRQNTIDIFAPVDVLKKTVMSIQTDSAPIAAPKNPDCCTIYQLYNNVADEASCKIMADKYRSGGYGYGQAKQILFETLLNRFESERAAFFQYVKSPHVLEEILKQGEAKAREYAVPTLEQVRSRIGY